MIHYITSDGIGQPWVATELKAVDQSGIPVVLHAIRKPQETHFDSKWAHRFNRDTHALYPLPLIAVTCSMLLSPWLFGSRFWGALANALFGKRENLRARVGAFAHLIVACHWARVQRHENITHIHAQWAYSSCSIAMYGSWLLGIPFSFTGHAVDLFRDRVALHDKIARADFIICISKFHRDFYLKQGAPPQKLHIAYCGINTTLFSPALRQRQPSEPLHIRSSGRLVEKKGFRYLIDACKILADRKVDFDCIIAGSGPLEQELNDQINQLKIADRITLTGQAINQEEIPRFMHAGDVYCLPCVWALDHDVDGLPQMLMEAMACGLPAISTDLVGIPDLIINKKTGLLVESNNAQELAQAIIQIDQDPQLAQQLAKAGLQHVRDHFDIETSLEPLINQYRTKLHLHKAPMKPPTLSQATPAVSHGAPSE